MPISNPDLINSCRVCRSPNQDGDYQCLYQFVRNHEDNQILTEAGTLYENLLDIPLYDNNCYPQFLCNSCDLQMKLFKKLKDKAYKTLEYLQNLDNPKEQSLQAALENYVYIKNDPEDESCKGHDPQVAEIYSKNEFEVYGENGIKEYGENNGDSNEFIACEENIVTQEYQGNADDECEVNRLSDFNLHVEEKFDVESSYQVEVSNTTQGEIEVGCQANKFVLKIDPTTNMSQGSNNSLENVRLKFEQALDKNDYVTEIYELLDDDSQDENCIVHNETLLDYGVPEENTASISEIGDIEFIIEDNMDTGENDSTCGKNREKRKAIKGGTTNAASTRRKRQYRCFPCQLEFVNLQDHKLHRAEVHNGKHPCSLCPNELKSMSALYHHTKMHNCQPAHKCEICHKTFKQKAHYQYHMKGHYNIRNYKCNLCEKAFISKTDLKVHLRLHSGERPYVCNICGKDYLMMEHLKSHLLSHSEQYFQCDICNKKFTTHKTLGLHVRTIHTDEPRFKCSLCMKPFRRKHHLEYHMRIHQKNVITMDSGFEMIDDPDVVSNEMDLVDVEEQDTIDNPGFIALSDYII